MKNNIDTNSELSRTKNSFSPIVLNDKSKLKMYKENRYLTLEQFREKLKSRDSLLQTYLTKKNENVPLLGRTSSTGFFPVLSQNPNITQTMNKTNAFSNVSIHSHNNSLHNFEKTMSNFHIPQVEPNENDMNILLTLYHKGHRQISDRKSRKTINEMYHLTKIEKSKMLKKYNLHPEVNDDEREEIKVMMKNASTSHFDTHRSITPNVLGNTVYKNPENALKKIKMNKQLQESITDMQTNLQVKKYMDIYSEVEDRDFKVKRMRAVKKFKVDPDKKKKRSLTLEQHIRQEMESQGDQISKI